MKTRFSAPVSLAWLLFAGLVTAPFAAPADESDPWTESGFAGLRLRGIGPAALSGRIADIAVSPHDSSTWFVAVGSGGVWKTDNAGVTFEPVFDGEGSYSIGCVTVDPSNPDVVWVGTGENVSGRHVGWGDGVYKSVDGGASWERVGLETSEHIGRILVHPNDSRTVWVAAEGPLWASGGDRGVFKTTDGGRTWNAVLEISADTGVTSLEMDPSDPDTLWAAAYQRRRHVWSLLAGGPESGIYKSTDGGETWREVTRGLPSGDMGKIGLAVTPAVPGRVYATIEAEASEHGLYASNDGGESWEKRSSYISNGTGPHYYQEIYASPSNGDRIYQADVWMQLSEDGGRSFGRLGEPWKHSDNHALWIDPDDPEHLIAGSDGGLYETFDHGANWRFAANLAVTQFYKLCLDDAEPVYHVVGGTQDNGTQRGPVRTLNVHGIANSDWTVPLGADGYACQVDPEDPNVIYAEWQRGSLVRYDAATGEALGIKPQPAPGDAPERWNWDAPILISPHASERLYFGSQRLWRSDDRGDSWRPVSEDLTRGLNRYELPLMGRVRSVDDLYDNGAMSWYSTLTAVAESPLVEGLLYTGSDDGVLAVSEDGGASWRIIESISGVPAEAFVNEVKASLHDPDTVFAVFDNKKVGDFRPYLVRSDDRGRTWASITGDLPDGHVLWSVVQDHVDPDLLFVGTEYDVRFSPDGGARWIPVAGAPTIAFRDLEIQRRESDLVGASFGRGMFVLDDYSPLRGLTADALAAEAVVFPVRDADWYVPSVPLAVPGKGYQGAGYYTAPNPPLGAVVTYHLAEKIGRTAKEQRREREEDLAEDGEDVPFPGWGALTDEATEEEVRLFVEIRDAADAVVRRIDATNAAGFSRIAWDLRRPAVEPVDLSPPGWLPPWASPARGPLVPPGDYEASLVLLEGGEARRLGEMQRFRVAAIENWSLPPADFGEVAAFAARTAELIRRANGVGQTLSDVEEKLPYLERAVLDAPAADSGLLARVRDVELEARAVRVRLSGDPVRSGLREPQVPSIFARLYGASFGHWDTRQGPTATHRRDVDAGEAGLAEISAALEGMLEDVRGIEAALEEAGAPWTPGREFGGAG